jgi:hypothetical protein
MIRKLLLSLVTAATFGTGLIASTTTAEAHRFHHYHGGYYGGFPGTGFGLFFGSPGFYNHGYYGNGFYNNGYYDDGYYDVYPRFHRVYRSCHIGNIRYHHRWHKARICNGYVTRIY